MPETLPPGRLRLATTPYFTGSLPVTNTIGIVDIAAFAARLDFRLPPVNKTFTGRSTKFAASPGRRSICRFAQRYSMKTLAVGEAVFAQA